MSISMLLEKGEIIYNCSYQIKTCCTPSAHNLNATLVSSLQLILRSLLFRLLVDTVTHFPPSLEEVTVSVNDERMWVRNHVEEHGSLFIFSISSGNSASDTSGIAVNLH